MAASAPDVNSDYIVEPLQIHLCNFLVSRTAAGIIDQAVQSPEGRHGMRNHRLDLRLVAHVCADEIRGLTERARTLASSFLSASRNHEPCSFARE